jgi:hypothetical protein
MSGGSYNYLHSKIDELDRWVSSLRHMAKRCREWASRDDDYVSKYVDGKRVRPSLEERACILVRALLLERAADNLQKSVREIEALEGILHDVEWVASGDYGVEQLMGKLTNLDR